ncbi:MAG TPA: hypothetical protein VKA38_05245 [Draconibacterium sp.]|nr:hypothetical protein [Draconibacterium sp.]
MATFQSVAEEIQALVLEWQPKFISLSEKIISERRNSQNRTIRQIVGHMVDSASNNTHRVVQLQYRELPLRFHNYATFGNNDKWIAIQNYQNENWENLVQLWKYTHLHFIHVIQNVNQNALKNEWIANFNEKITLQQMVEDFPRHFELHISEIEQLINVK